MEREYSSDHTYEKDFFLLRSDGKVENLKNGEILDKKDLFITPEYLKEEIEPLNTLEMPDHPVNPNEFINIVTKYLNQFGNVICTDAPEQIKSFCRLFNYNIQLNKSKEETRLIHAAQTGTAKSLSLQIYASMLKEESSLIVVSKVAEAIRYCEFINELRADDSYARCYYSITDKNKDHKYRVENYELTNHQCIVISHAMFLKLNQSKNVIDMYKNYNQTQRDLIVIDEKINLYNSYKASYKDIVNLKELIEDIYSSVDLIKDTGLEFTALDSIVKALEYNKGLHQATLDDPIVISKRPDVFSLMFDPKDDDKYEKLIDDPNDPDYQEIGPYTIDTRLDTLEDELLIASKLIDVKVNQIMEDIALFSKASSAHFKSSISKEKKLLIETIGNIFNTLHWFTYYDNFGVHLFSLENITNKLGSFVVLDATANINEFYKIAYHYNNTIKNTTVLRNRKYSNLSIYTAKGYRQGRNSIFKKLKKEEKAYNTKMYLSHADGILSKQSDNLLIITHKGFKSDLVNQCNDPRITFTHWGDHVGKNDWSHCNKVMVIGWNFINEIESLYSIVNAINDVSLTTEEIGEQTLDAMQMTQVVDDLVQGVMRTQARKIATKDGDCKKTEVYLYYEDIQSYNEILNLFSEQFPEAQVYNWNPVGIAPMVKKTKPNKNVDRIISYLEDKESNEVLDVMWKDVLNDLEITKPTGSRILNTNNYFKEQLDLKGYKLKNSDGKSKYIILK